MSCRYCKTELGEEHQGITITENNGSVIVGEICFTCVMKAVDKLMALPDPQMPSRIVAIATGTNEMYLPELDIKIKLTNEQTVSRIFEIREVKSG